MMHIVRNKHTRGWTGGESVPGVLHCARVLCVAL